MLDCGIAMQQRRTSYTQIQFFVLSWSGEALACLIRAVECTDTIWKYLLGCLSNSCLRLCACMTRLRDFRLCIQKFGEVVHLPISRLRDRALCRTPARGPLGCPLC